MREIKAEVRKQNMNIGLSLRARRALQSSETESYARWVHTLFFSPKMGGTRGLSHVALAKGEAGEGELPPVAYGASPPQKGGQIELSLFYDWIASLRRAMTQWRFST
jgi:hypothetical protein